MKRAWFMALAAFLFLTADIAAAPSRTLDAALKDLLDRVTDALANDKALAGRTVSLGRITSESRPDVNYGADRDLLAEVRGAREGLSVDLTFDNEVVDGLAERAKLKAEIKEREERCKAVEGLLMSRMRDAVVATVPGFSIAWRISERKGYTVAPSSPRVLTIRNKKGGAA